METPITLDQLEVFLAIVEEGSFSAAARKLGRAQSAVSYAISNLERLLEIVLFDREGRRPVLTDAGRALLADARAALMQAERLTTRARDFQRGLEPQLSLVVDMMFPLSVLLETLKEFQERFPSVSLTLYTEGLSAVAALVEQEVCQLGISGLVGGPAASLHMQPLTTLPMVTVTHPGHPLAEHAKGLDLELLGAHRQIVLTDRSSGADGSDRGVLSHRTWRVAELTTKLEMLRAGFGWGHMPRHMVAQDLERGSLVELTLTEMPLQLPLFVLHRKAQAPGIAGQWLIEALRGALEDF